MEEIEWREMERGGKKQKKGRWSSNSSHPSPRLFSFILFFALSPLSWNRQALLVSGDQITSNRRSKHARSGYVLCIAFILNGNQKEFWLYRCYACVIVTRRLVLRSLPQLISLRKQTLLLAHRRWGTFREKERLRLTDRNSILMT